MLRPHVAHCGVGVGDVAQGPVHPAWVCLLSSQVVATLIVILAEAEIWNALKSVLLPSLGPGPGPSPPVDLVHAVHGSGVKSHQQVFPVACHLLTFGRVPGDCDMECGHWTPGTCGLGGGSGACSQRLVTSGGWGARVIGALSLISSICFQSIINIQF